ncbi:MAG: FAD-binding oxidoreductase [Acetobacteraceae bacterium]|nr:FAD-binding oxidoreductase [Acetobacteraceae bacterium]
MSNEIFHPDFKQRPYWWEAVAPTEEAEVELPARTDVLIIGGGLTGLNCAIELARGGAHVTVLEANDFLWGASSRNGGGVSGGTNLGKGLSGSKGRSSDAEHQEKIRAMVEDSAASLAHVESIIAREGIQCHFELNGRFVGAFTQKHYDGLAGKVEFYNKVAHAGAEMVPRERQREEIASDYYYGGMRIERVAKLHPALYTKGLVDAARRHGATLAGRTPAGALTRISDGWRCDTPRGPIEADEVVIATNGYTGGLTPDLQRRVIPLASHIITTEELDPELAASLIPKNRVLSDTKRVLCYYRLSPDKRRVVFGGRARFTQVGPEVSAPALHGMMLERWPQLKGTRITHAWTGNTAFTFDFLPHLGKTEKGLHYAMGCNGSGVAMLSYLGAQLGKKLLGGQNRVTSFDGQPFPTRPLYYGKPWFLPPIGTWYRIRDWLDRRVG